MGSAELAVTVALAHEVVPETLTPGQQNEVSADFGLCPALPFHIGKSLPANQTFRSSAHEKTITCLFTAIQFKQTLITLNSFVVSVSGKREQVTILTVLITFINSCVSAREVGCLVFCFFFF